MPTEETVDGKYYQVATPGSMAEKLAERARDVIYLDFLRWTRPTPTSRVLDVGVSDVEGEAANVLERKYPQPDQITAVGLGVATEFQAKFPKITYRQIEPDAPLPFADGSFDIATSNAVLEHVGSAPAQMRFVAELARVSRQVFISVPSKFFPVEHHTGIPFLHWTRPTFRAATALLGKSSWAEEANLILMTRSRLRQLGSMAGDHRVGTTGLRLGPLSSNLFLYIPGRDGSVPDGSR